MYGILENGELIATFAAPLTVRNNRPVFASDSLSLKRNVNVRPAQRWEIQANLVPLSTNANELFVKITTSDHYQTIDVRMPQNTGSVHNRVKDPNTCYASGSFNGTSVSVLTSGTIPSGTFIRFGNHSKIYLTKTQRVGAGTMTIYPPLIQSVVNQVLYWQDDVVMPCLVDLDTTLGMVYTDGILMDLGTIKLVEKL
jgi:hypothetical protein